MVLRKPRTLDLDSNSSLPSLAKKLGLNLDKGSDERGIGNLLQGAFGLAGTSTFCRGNGMQTDQKYPRATV